jgi:hypothetical protein
VTLTPQATAPIPATATVSATPTDTPVPKLALETLAVAPIDLGLLFDSWSPDGQWVAYWVVEDTAGAEYPVFVNVIDGRRCQHQEIHAEGYDGRVDWQGDDQVTVVLNQQGEAAGGSVCGTFATVKGGALPGRRATEEISPDGRYRAERRFVKALEGGGESKSVTITDVASGQTIATVPFVTSSNYGWSGQGWLNDKLYLVGVAVDQGILYISLPSGRIGEVLPDFFGLDVADERFVTRVDLQADPATGVYHILVQIYKSSSASPPLVYHSELDRVEQVAFYFAWPWYSSSSFTPDGHWLLLGDPVEAGTPGPYTGYWLRPVDPPGSAAIQVVRGVKFEGLSGDARALAEFWADMAFGQWRFCGLSRSAQQVAFCRDTWVRIYALTNGSLLGERSVAPYGCISAFWIT